MSSTKMRKWTGKEIKVRYIGQEIPGEEQQRDSPWRVWRGADDGWSPGAEEGNPHWNRGPQRWENGMLNAMTLPLFQLSVSELLENELLQTRNQNKIEEDRRSREQGMPIGQGLKMLQQPGQQAPLHEEEMSWEGCGQETMKLHGQGSDWLLEGIRNIIKWMISQGLLTFRKPKVR